MAVKASVAVRNGKLDAVEAVIGASAILKIRSGAAPANMTDPDSGTVLATVPLPADWMAAAVNGTKAMSGTWEDLAADAAGTAGHYRIYASDGVTQHLQGSITATGGGGDMQLDNTVLAVGQEFRITEFSWTEGNA